MRGDIVIFHSTMTKTPEKSNSWDKGFILAYTLGVQILCRKGMMMRIALGVVSGI